MSSSDQVDLVEYFNHLRSRIDELIAQHRSLLQPFNDGVLLAHQTLEGRWRNATGVVEKMPTATAITDDDVCSICLEGLQGGTTTSTPKQPPCGHVYHQNCLAKWLSRSDSCPLCRCSATQSSSNTVDD
uniref:ERAD-associated E3 ubiquitin-protein ligase HRD1-like n=1 Tax=Fragaria vesca subsp. vesca TaxID=101020 RepID=UPI0005C9D4E6|nr:PREDICTED: ERAD-associated E3 ubiquitin-protein ligase HRD1-like [Fragaria vesca subsp. vesca]